MEPYWASSPWKTSDLFSIPSVEPCIQCVCFWYEPALPNGKGKATKSTKQNTKDQEVTTKTCSRGFYTRVPDHERGCKTRDYMSLWLLPGPPK